MYYISEGIKEINKSGQENRRHPEASAYRCFLSDLTGFTGLRRAGPTRTGEGYPKTGEMSTNEHSYVTAAAELSFKIG